MPSGYPVDTSFLEEAVRLKGEGLSYAAISRIVGVDRRVVGKYIKKSDTMGLNKPKTKEARKYQPKPHPLYSSQEERNAICQRRISGLSVSKIAKEFNRSEKMVVNTCRSIPPDQLKRLKDTLKITDSDKLRIYKMRSSGKSVNYISSFMNVSNSTIEYHLKMMKDKTKSFVSESQKSSPITGENDNVREEFIAGTIKLAIGNVKSNLHVPEHVTRMKLSLMMSRGFSEVDALAQAMSFYSRGKVTSADDDYAPRKLVIRRKK